MVVCWRDAKPSEFRNREMCQHEVAGGLFGLPGPSAGVTGIAIPGNPLRSFDISWVNPDRGEYYLGDRSNAGIDVVGHP